MVHDRFLHGSPPHDYLNNYPVLPREQIHTATASIEEKTQNWDLHRLKRAASRVNKGP